MSNSEASAGESDYSSSDFNDDDESPVAKKSKKTPLKPSRPDPSAATKKKEPSVKATKDNKASNASKASLSAKPPSKPPSAAAVNNAVSSSSASTGGGPGAAPVSLSATSSSASGSIDITQGPPVASESAARKLIMQYMKQQNRPYSAIQVFENLHQRISKPMVQRLLDDLSTPASGDPEASTSASAASGSLESALRCKEYGKAKIYFVDQSKLQSQFSESEVAEVKAQVDAKEAELAALQSTCSRLQAEANALASEPGDADLDRVIHEIQRRLAEKQSKLASVKGVVIDERDLVASIEEFNYYRTAWKTRKDKCLGALDMIADGMEKSRSAVVAMVGIETDEDAGITGGCPSALPVPKPQPQQGTGTSLRP